MSDQKDHPQGPPRPPTPPPPPGSSAAGATVFTPIVIGIAIGVVGVAGVTAALVIGAMLVRGSPEGPEVAKTAAVRPTPEEHPAPDDLDPKPREEKPEDPPTQDTYDPSKEFAEVIKIEGFGDAPREKEKGRAKPGQPKTQPTAAKKEKVESKDADKPPVTSGEAGLPEEDTEEDDQTPPDEESGALSTEENAGRVPGEPRPCDEIRLHQRRTLALPPLSRLRPSTPVKVARVSVDSANDCRLSLLGQEVAFGQGVSIFLNVENPDDTIRTWVVMLDDRRVPGGTQRLGTFALENRSLTYRWERSATTEDRERLGFCLLRVEAQGDSVVCFLRPPVEVEPAEINLQKRPRPITVPLRAQFLPAARHLRVDFALEGPLAGQRGVAKGVEVGEPGILRIPVATPGGAPAREDRNEIAGNARPMRQRGRNPQRERTQPLPVFEAPRADQRSPNPILAPQAGPDNGVPPARATETVLELEAVLKLAKESDIRVACFGYPPTVQGDAAESVREKIEIRSLTDWQKKAKTTAQSLQKENQQIQQYDTLWTDQLKQVNAQLGQAKALQVQRQLMAKQQWLQQQLNKLKPVAEQKQIELETHLARTQWCRAIVALCQLIEKQARLKYRVYVPLEGEEVEIVRTKTTAPEG